MTAEKFLTIGDENISLPQALGYLRASGDLQQFLMRILRQHVIAKEIAQRTDLEVDSSQIEQAIVNFRLQNQLVNPQSFDQWLTSQGTNYTDFRKQVTAGLKFELLKQVIVHSKVEEVFNQNKDTFEQVILSRIVVDNLAKAEELKTQLDKQPAQFEKLVKEHSTTSDRLFNGMMGAVTVGQLPEKIRALLEDAQPGDIVGPVEFQNLYSILRLEQRIPATLSGQLKQNLEEQVFEQWWQLQLQNQPVKLHIEPLKFEA